MLLRCNSKLKNNFFGFVLVLCSFYCVRQPSSVILYFAIKARKSFIFSEVVADIWGPVSKPSAILGMADSGKDAI